MIKSTLEKRYLVGRRLVLNFPHAINAQMGVFELPRSKALVFSVEDMEQEGRLYSAVMMRELGGEPQKLVVFQSRQEAALAVQKISKKLSWTFASALKAFLQVLGAIFLVVMLVIILTPSPAERQAARRPQSPEAPAGAVMTPDMERQVRELTRKSGANGAVAPTPPVGTPAVPTGTQAAPAPVAPQVSGQGSTPDAAAAIELLKGAKN